jgi:hypothetical protein
MQVALQVQEGKTSAFGQSERASSPGRFLTEAIAAVIGHRPKLQMAGRSTTSTCARSLTAQAASSPCTTHVCIMAPSGVLLMALIDAD